MFQGDNTQAFGNNFIRVYMTFRAPDGTELPLPPMSKIEARVGSVVKEYLPDDFSEGYLDINFTEEESAQLSSYNTLFLAAYDETGKKKTLLGKYVFSSCPRRV